MFGHKLMGLASALVLAAAPAAHADEGRHEGEGKHDNPFMNVPVSGTTDQGDFNGTLDVQRFEAIHGQVVAVGLLRGATRQGRMIKDQAVALPVQTSGSQGALFREDATRPALFRGTGASTPLIIPAQAACPVLNLALGPLDLDLLGLVVHLNQVQLNVVAQPGQGQLLGNLLCAVTNLLDNFNPNLGAALANALNQLAAFFAGLGV
jgi:hypothetical protein